MLLNREMNDFVCVCWACVGALGYVAVSVCSRVQVLRPRASTSGGQCAGSVYSSNTALAAATVAWVPVLELGFLAFVMANQDATSVHERHLHVLVDVHG